MRRFLLTCFLFFQLFEANSQNIIGSTVQGIDCNNSNGYITIITDISPSFYFWYFYDDSTSSWTTYLTGTNEDSVSFSECGNYRAVIYDASFNPSDTADYVGACPMRTKVRAHQNVLCFGDSTGMLKEVVTGGIPFIDSNGNEYYNYDWYQNGSLFSSGPYDTVQYNLTAGSYWVNVTDASGSGCVFQPIDSLTGSPAISVIFQPPLLRIDSLSINLVTCQGTNTGSFTVNVKDGKRYQTDYYNYYLTDVASDTIRILNRDSVSDNVYSAVNPYYVTFDSLYTGSYTLHVTDSFGCSLDSTIYISEPDDYLLHTSNSPMIVCEQDSTWIIIDSISGGNSSIEYYWSLNLHQDSMYVRSGLYQVIVYDTICKITDTLDYLLEAPNTIYSDITSTNAFCYGTNTGTITIDSIYGGILPYNIQWGGVNPDSLYAGTYTVLITDSLGCMHFEDVIITETDDISLNAQLYPPSCFGFSDGSIVIDRTGGTQPYGTSIWSPNATGGPDSLFSLSADIYVLQTVDYLGCTYTDSVTLSEPDSLLISFSGYDNPLFCHGSITLINANVSGGTGDYNLLWNTGNLEDTTYQLVVYAGSYTLDVIDENGCSMQQSIMITQPDSLVVTGSFIPGDCNLGGSASVIYSGGTEPVSYIWSNGETTSSASNLMGGDHWVIVTDSCGDTSYYDFTIDEYILETDIAHYNNPNSFAEVTVVASTVGAPFTYQWYDENLNIINGSIDSEISNICEGWYFVVTRDSNSCEVIDSVYASFYFPMGVIVDESTTTVLDDVNLWGSGPYTYLWDNGETTAHGNVCDGIHRVWVTDVNGCEVVGEVNVEQIELSLSPEHIIIECDISNIDIELEVSATGGIGNYNYLWSNGETMNPINLSLYPGLYSVEVTDENMCQVDTVFHIAAMSEDCIPNVFTPNNDGMNDVWNLEDAFFYLDTEIKVYGRYGKLVFESTGYASPWDGTNRSGNPVEDGAYFYVIDLGHDIEKIKGTVSIIR